MPEDRSTERNEKNKGEYSGGNKRRWQGKRMHGKFSRNLDEKLVDIEQSYRWLKSGDIKGETESTIVAAAQDQAISTNYFKNQILKQEIESKCRLCEQNEETIDHLTSGSPILAKNEYLMGHDKVCTHLHYSICKTLITLIKNKKEKTCTLIDVAVPADRNVVQK